MGYQTSPLLTQYYSTLICMYSNSTALEVRLWSETQPTCLSGILKSWQKSWLWSFLSRTSNASRGSPNQVKHIDLFSFRKKKRERAIGQEHILLSNFRNISAPLSSFFLWFFFCAESLSTVKVTEFCCYLFSLNRSPWRSKGKTSISTLSLAALFPSSPQQLPCK